MRVQLVSADGSKHEVDLRGGLWFNGGGQGLIAVDDTEPPDIVAEEKTPGSFDVPRIFVKYRDADGNQFYSEGGTLPIFIEALYTSTPPIR